MAAGLGFKDFTTGEVLTAADVDGYLMQGVWVFASAAARDAAVTSPQEGNFAYLKDTNVTTYYTGSAWATLAAGGGKVLQVVQGTTTSTATVASTTFTDTNLTASITPSSATSKILILFTQSMNSDRASSPQGGSIKLLRDATDVYSQDGAGGGYGTFYANPTTLSAPVASTFHFIVNGTYLDSPATTSAITYKTQGRAFSTANSGNVAFQPNSVISTIVLMEIGA
jgi:hypothetical protein